MSIEHQNALPPKTQIKKYNLVKLLGHGGFGLTYLAVDTQLGRQVAIKELLPHDFATRQRDGVSIVARSSQHQVNLDWAKTRFLEEARTLALLHHKSILPIYDFFAAHGTAYLVTAFVEGGNLEEWLRQHPRPSEAVLRSMTLALLEALQLVHASGYLHRDIKPENILMDRTTGQPVLIDFGNARMATSQKSAAVTAIVTKGYAPFEQYQTKGKQGAWTDLYALGAVLFRAITGHTPADSTDRVENDNLPRLSQKPLAGFSKEFLATIDKALQFRKENRWQSCEEWRAALVGSTQAEQASKSKLPLVLGIVVLLALLGISLAFLLQPKAQEVVAQANVPSPTPPQQAVNHPVPTSHATPAVPPPSTPGVVNPKPAPATQPAIVDSGMKFQKFMLANSQPLFCSIWETRNKDCAPWDQRFNLPGHELEPATNITVKQIESFCAWLRSKDGRNYRLPTDYEWSCMVGLGCIENQSDPLSKKRIEHQEIFPWGSSPTPPDKYGNYGIDGYPDGYAGAAPVGHYLINKNSYGLFDLSGNAREVCSTKATTGLDTRYVVRGGSWSTTAISGGNPYGGLSSARRDLIQEDAALSDVGFRLVYNP